MDSGILITALLILLLAVLPFVAYSLLNKMRRGKLLSALNTQAQSAGVTIAQHELLNHLAMGINENRTWLFFAKRVGGRYNSYAVNLSTVANCRVETISKSEPGYGGVFTINTQRVEMHFTLKEGGTAPVVWELYNSVNNGTIVRGEHEFAEKWSKAIQPYLGLQVKATARG